MLLDNYLPAYEFNEVHTIVIQASPDEILGALKELTPVELSPWFRILFAIRQLPARLMGNDEPGFLPDRPLLEQMFDNGFVLLAENERELVFGTIGRFWELSQAESIPLVRAQEFLAFDQPGYAKAVGDFRLSQEKDHDDFVVRTETRIHIADPKARKKFAAYWRIIYPGSAWIRRMWLKAIKRRAERG
jgi:hypothetical protein